jgi:hypothetical protein
VADDAPERRVKRSSFEAAVEKEVARLRETIQGIEAAPGRVLVGPFTGEVGFELLYWIPLLRWAVREFPGLRGRLVVVSRGGTQWWYSGLDVEYVDLFTVSSVDEVVRRRKGLKQREITEYEEEVLARAAAALSIERALILHVSILFDLYYRVRKIDQHGFARSVRLTENGVEGLAAVYATLPKPPGATLEGVLPDEYVAVRFYYRSSFPESAENRNFASAVVKALARKQPVVLLNTGLTLDDHADLSTATGGRVVTIDHAMRPSDNLHVQAIALSRASAFVGTYGGLAYLAPLFGVPSVGFSSHPECTRPWHLELAQNVFRAPGFGSIVASTPADLQLIHALGLQP